MALDQQNKDTPKPYYNKFCAYELSMKKSMKSIRIKNIHLEPVFTKIQEMCYLQKQVSLYRKYKDYIILIAVMIETLNLYLKKCKMSWELKLQ